MADAFLTCMTKRLRSSSKPIAEAAVLRARATGADVRLLEDDGTIPFGHGEFDLVWCSEVLEHVPDTIGLLTEARRVLKRGGRLLVTVPDHGRLKRTLIALSHAIEDECAARAERPLLFGSFQRERFYRDSEPRWRELVTRLPAVEQLPADPKVLEAILAIR